MDSARLSVDPLAQKAVQEIGLDLRNHHTRSMNQIVLNKYDLIVMEKGHKETLNAKSPECDGKLHLLIHLAGGSEDVPDPSGKNLPFHLQTAMEMVRLISTAYTRICELAAI